MITSGKLVHIFSAGLAIASLSISTAYASKASSSPANYGLIQFSYIRADGVKITESRTIDMDLYISSGGGNINPILITQVGACDTQLPTVVVWGDAPPPPSSLDWSVSTINIIQDPISGGGGPGGWHRKYTYTRPIYKKPNTTPPTWDKPGDWNPPFINDFQGPTVNVTCTTSTE